MCLTPFFSRDQVADLVPVEAQGLSSKNVACALLVPPAIQT